jgi:hypothetical protein
MAMADVTGRQLVERLQGRGRALNTKCQRLVTAAGDGSMAQHVLEALHGRRPSLPSVAKSILHLRKDVERSWASLRVDIADYARQLERSNGGGSEGTTSAAYEAYLANVVLATLQLEATTPPSELADPIATSGLLGAHEAATLRSEGFVVLQGVDTRGAITADRLKKELALLHTHGVITPSTNSCNPGAHGVNVRCGTAEERDSFRKQGTPTLLAAIELLRALPHALEQLGYLQPGAEELAVPGTILLSTYPPG